MQLLMESTSSDIVITIIIVWINTEEILSLENFT